MNRPERVENLQQRACVLFHNRSKWKQMTDHSFEISENPPCPLFHNVFEITSKTSYFCRLENALLDSKSRENYHNNLEKPKNEQTKSLQNLGSTDSSQFPFVSGFIGTNRFGNGNEIRSSSRNICQHMGRGIGFRRSRSGAYFG